MDLNLYKNCKNKSIFQVTVLLFREGHKVNLYHVIEKPDGSFSPITDLNENDERFTPNSSNSSVLNHSRSKRRKNKRLLKKLNTNR